MDEAIISIPLWENDIPNILNGAYIPNKMTAYLIKTDRPLPCMIIFPGGGYCANTKAEGIPYADFFNKQGFHAIVIDYRFAPNRYPSPLLDAQRAIKLARAHSKEWMINPNQIVTVGSSAGGHLAAACAVMPDAVYEARTEYKTDDIDKISAKPNGSILCYPVIELGGEFGHIGSGKNLLGDMYDEMHEEFSLIHRINESTPPCFLWHTAEDEVVDVKNSLAFCARLHDFSIPFALRIYPKGPHALALAENNDEIKKWAYDAADFVKNHICGETDL